MISKDINIKDDTNWYTLLDLIYPVGSIYCSTKATSPASLMGGTWSAINGKFLLGKNSTYTLGSTGGAATHKLTTNEMPSHSHSAKTAANTPGPYSTSSNPLVYAAASMTSTRVNSAHSGVINNAGSGAAHNNMPPYQAVSIWERTA